MTDALYVMKLRVFYGLRYHFRKLVDAGKEALALEFFRSRHADVDDKLWQDATIQEPVDLIAVTSTIQLSGRARARARALTAWLEPIRARIFLFFVLLV